MSENKIRSVAAEMNGTQLSCRVTLQEGLESKVDLAFYVFRSETRVHVKWYSKDSSLEFDTEGHPGYYRVAVFAKRADGTVEVVKSVPLFMNPLQVTADEFPEADPDKRAYLVDGGFWKCPIMYYPASNKKLFVMMPSAVERWRVRLPVFSRWTWASKGTFPGHVLCIADPTLEMHDDLGIGWCLGTSAHPAIDDIEHIIAKFALGKRISNENIVFWGSSAGGFASLALTARFPGSTAVAINAQTNPLSYSVQEQVDLVRQTCFGGLPGERIRTEFGHLVDMTRRWSPMTGSRAVMIQNELDVHHYDVHFKPFWQVLGGKVQHGISHTGTHLAWVYTNEHGHVPETPEMAQKIIGMLGGDRGAG
ncbi:hypothetical protein NX786_16705 [Telluria mixta]|uniref:Peptidase S9 prolyl oligopeptidase catalytic domain-containing protein n=1 Tax=Telluria mixta TaxID=34071 RepID=A0ABT2C0S3_9BURK|nr:hypothetical protein [Telluria mixta]MCS0630974.1 hypothetical protein [Telluria mixta]WEM98972.1 hypothetical protein P0M04_15080 [Telluria mixta]